MYIIMNLIARKEVKYSLGAVSLGALIYGMFKLYKFFIRKSQKISKDNDETRSEGKESISSQDYDFEHVPYEQLIEDLNNYDLSSGELRSLSYLKKIQYRIILCLLKGNAYQGIVNITFHLQPLSDSPSIQLDFSGTGIKFVKVNGKKLQPHEVKYSEQRILLPVFNFNQNAKNTIEVIFENNYSFLNNGLGSYFLIDDNNKYSLRQQVIYSFAGWNQIANIIPCFNCTNQCTVHLEVIHPDNFQAFSNTTKELERKCSITEYPKYPFLFDRTQFSSRSLHLKSSNASLLNSSDSISNYSSTTYYGRKRANTHFHTTKLPSIHQLFLFSSEMMELVPAGQANLDKDVLIRYFCKQANSHHFTRAVSQMHQYIIELFRRLTAERIKHKIFKIDIFIINDEEIQGHLAPGALILSQQAVKSMNSNSSCYYLLARGIMGILRLAQGQNTLKISQILDLNYSVFQRFQQLRSYVYLMNLEYKNIREVINDDRLSVYLLHNEAHFLQYYCRELRYIIREKISDKIPFQLKNVLSTLKKEAPEQFWEKMISNYNFFSPVIIDPLLAYGLKTIGPPNDKKLLQHLRICFNSSKYSLSFYTDKQISQNLPKFMECQAFGLEDRLPKLRVLQKFKDFITEKYHNYLPVKSNTSEASIFYSHFKTFNEKKNFHHYSTLKSEIRRVIAFGQNFIVPERVPLSCSLSAWKLLKEIKMYPADPRRYHLLKTIDNIQEV